MIGKAETAGPGSRFYKPTELMVQRPFDIIVIQTDVHGTNRAPMEIGEGNQKKGRNRMKKLSVILAALLLLAVAIPLAATAKAWPAEPAAADIGETGPDTGLAPLANAASDFSYTIANGAVTITGYTGKSQTVVIPETIGGYPVTAIGDRAFYARNNLISITMPQNVTSIGAYAFYGCNGLPGITIPDHVTTIGEGAFFLCSSLSSIRIPEKVTSIGPDAFRTCIWLQTIEYNAVKLTTTNIAFEEAGRDLGVRVTFGESVKQIPDYLFYGCRVTSAAIPNSVTSIGAYAFGGCRELTAVTIPAGVTSLGAFAFSGTGMTTVTVPDGVTTIREGTFSGCESLTSAVISAGVTSIGEAAFSGCSSLTTVTIPTSVKNIGNYAFSACGSLMAVTIPAGVTSIGENAFSDCGSLASVTIPKNVKSIGEGAFSSCYNLTDIVYNATSVSDLTHSGAFTRAGAGSGQTRVKIGTAVERIPAYLFFDCSCLVTVTIPNNVIEIGAYAFSDCYNLTTVNLPENLKSIRKGTFQDCHSLTGITLPAGLTTLEEQAFYDCSSLASVTIQGGVRKIGPGAFSRCYALSELVLPEGITEIGEYAFDFGGITHITLPVSLTAVGGHAFEHCSLAEVFYSGRETEWLRVSVGESNGPLLSADFHFAEIPPEITVQPTDQNVPAGSTAVFTVTAEGTHLTYRWQYSDNGGETWINCDPEEGVMASFRFTVSKSLDGMMYRCVVTDEYGTVTSDSALLTVEAGPEFKVQNLVLSGQIGVNFFLDLSMLTEAERSASYMEFSIDGKGAATAQDPFDANHMNGTKKYYGFTFYVNSIQMADTITATYHYGNRQTVSKTYSVEEYFKTFDQHAAENPKKTVDLVHAIADYGHYMQLYLASVNGFTLGTDYAELTRHYTESYDWADILSKVEEHAIARTYGTSKVEKANYRLQLGSETTLDVFLKTTDGSAPTDVTVTIREEVTGTTTTKAYTPEKQADGRYLVTIPNISAHKLGDKVTVTGNAGGSFTVVVSPLSFVRDVLKNETKTESLNGLSSLYAYYMAAIAYKS